MQDTRNKVDPLQWQRVILSLTHDNIGVEGRNGTRVSGMWSSDTAKELNPRVENPAKCIIINDVWSFPKMKTYVPIVMVYLHI